MNILELSQMVQTKTDGAFTLVTVKEGKLGIRLRIRHEACGELVRMSLSEFESLTSFTFCPCQRLIRQEAAFKAKLEATYPGEYELVEPYQGAHHHILFKHIPCGHTRPYRPSDLLYRNISCKCHRSPNQAKTKASVLPHLNPFISGKYELGSDFKGWDEPVTVTHLACNTTYQDIPSLMQTRKCRCPHCSSLKQQERLAHYRSTLPLAVSQQYDVVGPYQTLRQDIPVKHHTCGHLFLVSPVSLRQGHAKCPNCQQN